VNKYSIWAKIVNQSELVAHDMVQIVFFRSDYTWKRPGKNESRKVAYSEAKRHFHEAAFLAQSLIIENIYLIAKDIREDQTLTDRQKTDLLFGEIEILLQENTNQLSSKYGKGTHTSIEKIRETHGVICH